MLIGQKLNQIDRALNEIANAKENSLYETLQKDLITITENLTKDIKKAETRLENKLALENKEYQDLTSTWIKNELNELKPEIKSKIDKKADEVLSNLSQSITNSINTQIKEKIQTATANLHTKIDLKQVINNIKSSQSLMNEIKQGTKNDLKAQLQTSLPELKESSKNELLQKLSREVDLNKCIKIALETQMLNSELQKEVGNKAKDIIDAYLDKGNLKQEVSRSVESMKNSFLEFINKEKQSTINSTSEKIKDIDSYLNATKEDLKQRLKTHEQNLQAEEEAQREAIKVVINEFSEYVKDNESDIVEKIIENISDDLNTNDLYSTVENRIYQEALNDILDEKHEIEERVIDEVTEHFITTITKEKLLEKIIENESIVNHLETLAIDLLNEKLSHALIKDYVTECLKEKAKEILKSDELLRAEAQAQAHLSIMQMQSKLESFSEVMNALKQEHDYTAELQELAQKRQELSEALSEAKDELKQELAQTALSDKMQKLITDTLTQELENLKTDVVSEANKLITQLQDTQKALIQANQQEIEKLKEKLKEMQISGNQKPQTDNVDNKTLATT